MKRYPFILYPLLALGVGALSGFLSREGLKAVFPTLIKPALSPPGMIFPIVWTVLYLLMGLGLALAVRRGGPGVRAAGWAFGVQLALNFGWSLLFFSAGLYLAALVWLVALWLAILWMVLAFYAVRPAAGLLQLPYLFWVGFAGYLNWAIWRLNG